MTSPDFGLPKCVEALDGVLQSGLAWRGEHLGDTQSQAQSCDAPDAVRELVSTLEDGVVVKLGVAGQAVLLPALQQQLHGVLRGAPRHDPSVGQCAVQTGGGENRNQRTVGDLQILDEVEGIQLRPGECHLWQVPALWGGRAALPMHGVDCTVSLQNAMDCCPGWDMSIRAGRVKRGGDRRGAILTQHTVSQALTGAQDALLHARAQAVGGPAGLVVSEIDPIQTLALCTRHPQRNGAHAHAKRRCDATQGTARAHGVDHALATTLKRHVFFIATSSKRPEGSPRATMLYARSGRPGG